ncbi:hypothetical protein [Larkinella arboricola]
MKERVLLKNKPDAGRSAATTLKLERNDSFLKRAVSASWVILLIAAFFQCIIFTTVANITVVLCIIFAWNIITKFFLINVQLQNYPLSTFLIIGFAVTQFYFPIVFTLLEGKPVVFNLILPYTIFAHSIIALIVLLFSHAVYRSLAGRYRSNHILTRVGLFEPPTDIQLWAMGFLGLVAMYYVYFYSPSVGREVTGPIDKMIQGLTPFTYAPFLIPFGKLYGRKGPAPKRLVPMLLVFTVMLFVVSLGRNSRGAFMLGFASIAFAYALGLLLGVFKSQLLTFKNVTIVGLVVWLLTGPIADLGTAMVLVRAQRNSTDRSQLIEMTLEKYRDKEALQAAKLASKLEVRDWDEHYMDNIFLARFCNIKLNDASLVMAEKLGDHNEDVLAFSMGRLVASLPEPVINMIGFQVDKKFVTSSSFGDYMYYKTGAGESSLGSFRTGQFAGTGMAAFGWWYLLILGVGMIPVFFLFDKLTLKKYLPATGDLPFQKEVRFSVCGLLLLYATFIFLYEESVVSIGTFIIRGYPQKLVLYLVAYHLTRMISNLIMRITRRKQYFKARPVTAEPIHYNLSNSGSQQATGQVFR